MSERNESDLIFFFSFVNASLKLSTSTVFPRPGDPYKYTPLFLLLLFPLVMLLLLLSFSSFSSSHKLDKRSMTSSCLASKTTLTLRDGDDDDDGVVAVSETRRMNADFIESANSNRRRLMMIKTYNRVYDDCA